MVWKETRSQKKVTAHGNLRQQNWSLVSFRNMIDPFFFVEVFY